MCYFRSIIFRCVISEGLDGDILAARIISVADWPVTAVSGAISAAISCPITTAIMGAVATAIIGAESTAIAVSIAIAAGVAVVVAAHVVKASGFRWTARGCFRNVCVFSSPWTFISCH